MKKVFIINAHEYYPFAEGKLNQSFVDKASDILKAKGHEIKFTSMKDEYDVDQEIEKHQWADVVILQSPVYWMGISASFKKYMDTVYTGGMDGRLCTGDGRSREDATKQYGSGGALQGKQYMLSLTLNAPCNAFNDPAQTFFAGASIDDLFLPMHLNFKFFAMSPLKTFSCHDVLKNPEIENDFIRFEKHLNELF